MQSWTHEWHFAWGCKISSIILEILASKICYGVSKLIDIKEI